MKKRISVITQLPRSARFYAAQVRELFGDRVEVGAFSTKDRSVEGLGSSDLYLLSTDAFEDAEEAARFLPGDAQIVKIELTYPRAVIEELKRLPRGTNVLFVNATRQMAREAVTQLEQLGVNHLAFEPYGPDSPVPPGTKLAVTPDEEELVPAGIERVINIGHRPCEPGTMIEAAIRLGLESLLEERQFQAYIRLMAAGTHSIDEVLARLRRMESRFDMLLESLADGMIGVNERGEVYACNRRAEEIAGVRREQVLGRSGREVFPYIPFGLCMRERAAIPQRLVKIGALNVNLSLTPVLRKGECIGAFATLEPYHELERRQNELRSQLLQKGYRAKYGFEDVVGDSQAIEKTKAILKRMAVTESPVLLIGETGTGKELFAHAVHLASGRCRGPFVAINVAAVPETLLESELFGYEDGAFTGAKRGGRPGLFEFAQGGTLFLDEVEGMSQAMQVKLLRVLQEREIMRVGGNQMIHVDARIVAATNESLEEKVEDGSFRRDLYYRLNALPVLIPPLRERGGDILLLLETFRERGGGSFRLSKEVEKLFLAYRWPGNIRELQNVVEYLNFTGQETIGLGDLPPTFSRLRGLSGAVNSGTGVESRALGGLNPAAASGVSAGGSASAGAAWPGGSASSVSGESLVPGGFGAASGESPAPGASVSGASVAPGPAPSSFAPHPYTGPRSPYPPECLLFVLEQLYLASERGEALGRERILAAARELHLPLSQREVRAILGELNRLGLARVSRGRGGSRITPTGRKRWEESRNVPIIEC